MVFVQLEMVRLHTLSHTHPATHAPSESQSACHEAPAALRQIWRRLLPIVIAMSDSQSRKRGRTTAMIHASCVTGATLSDAAASVKDLAMRVDGTCSARGLARISRFAWMMGARAKWSTDGMSFKDLCSALDTHILEHILPKCEPRYVFLPDVTGDGWRPDLGIQSPTKPQMARFTTWMTMVAAGALSGMALLDGRDQPSDGSSKLEYHRRNDGPCVDAMHGA